MDKYADWPDKTAAARRIGISTKTLERMAARNEIEQRSRRRPGQQPVAVYNPQDVERKASQRAAVNEKPFVLSPEEENLPAVVQNGNRPQFLESLGQMLDKILNQPRPEAPHLITWKEAQALGWTRVLIRDQIAAGNLRRFGRRISRYELERIAGRTERDNA